MVMNRAILFLKRSFSTYLSICQKHDPNKVMFLNSSKFHIDLTLADQYSKGPDEDQLRILNDKFGLPDFKDLQWLSITATLSSLDSFVCLSSGYGKSLCYQYPAVYKNGLSIVFSPLISLMQDQIRLLEEKNISSCHLASTQLNKKQLIRMIIDGHFNIVYITPETAFNHGMNILNEIYKHRPITLFAVDEAHCILHWGRDFRMTYKKLTYLRTCFPKVPILALTATANDNERNYIINILKMKNPRLICDKFDRPNLYFMAKPASNESIDDIMDIINTYKEKFNENEGSILIYCITKKMTEKIANLLRIVGLTCQVYHSNLNREDRQTVLNNFINNKFKVMVATTAFGMGINKPDIRLIIHYGTSLNMEGYYQEAGRAGRDGKPALCALLYSATDFGIHRYLNGKSCKSIDSLKFNEDNNEVMKKYIMTTSCRRKFILSHFNSEPIDVEPKNCCDNCTNGDLNYLKYDCSFETELFLRTIESLLPKTYGIKTIVLTLLGVKQKKVLEVAKDNKFYGKGQRRDENWWRYLALHLETEKFIQIKSCLSNNVVYSNAYIASKGKSWLRDKCVERAAPIYMKINDNISECDNV